MLTVHLNTWVPTARSVTVVVALAGVVMIAPAGPPMMLHTPVAGAVAAVAASVVFARPVPFTVHRS